jgi:hypothetical protein
MPAPAWTGVVGNALAETAKGYLEGIDEAPLKRLQREKATAESALLPLETQARAAALRQQLTQPQIKALGAGTYALIYPDGHFEVKRYGASAAPKLHNVPQGPVLQYDEESGKWAPLDLPETVKKGMEHSKPSYLQHLIGKYQQGTSTPQEDAVIQVGLMQLWKPTPESGQALRIPPAPNLSQILGPKGVSPSESSDLSSGAPKIGYLGPQQVPSGGVATVRLMGVSDERLNGGRETNIPLLVPGQIDIQGLAAGRPPTQAQREIAIQHALGRIARGETIPSYNSIAEAEDAARYESTQRAQQLGRPPTSQPIQVTPGRTGMAPRVGRYRDYLLRLGTQQAKALVDHYTTVDPQQRSPLTKDVLAGYALAYPPTSEQADEPSVEPIMPVDEAEIERLNQTYGQ